MLQIEKVSKTYHSKGIDYPVLKEITATVHDGEFVAIMGPSIMVQLSRQKSKIFIMN